MKKKLVVLVLVVLLAFLGLSVRLFMITRDNEETYKRQVLSQQSYDSTTLPYKRGDIVDCNGTVLASSEKVYNLVMDAKDLLNHEDDLDYSLQIAEQCFPALVDGDVRSYINSNPSSQYKVWLKQLSYEEITPYLEAQDDAENGSHVHGFWFEEEYKRTYPNNALACDVIGFTTSDGIGQFGLEEYYNDELSGTNGREYGYLNDTSTLERTVVPAVDGNTVVSTIDANIQSVVEKYLKEFSDEHMNEARDGLGANNLGAIVMEVDTGNILAMASYPNFDLNNPTDLSSYYTEEELAAMTSDDSFLDTCNNLWRNFCISDTYEPGSTIKPFTVAAALDAGVITGNETYLCEGVREIGGYEIHCHNRYGDGLITVKQAVETSCNIALTYIAEELQAAGFTEYQHNFNFGLKTNIDLAGEARTDSLVYTAETMGATELATNSFGQSFNVTMIQVIAGFCSLVNGGTYYEPHMVSQILAADGSVVKSIEPKALKQTVSESVSETIIDYCNGVVTEGTGKTARPAGYAIGGKTGTAQTLPRGNGEYIVSFMGYAPADDPQIAIYVVVDRPNVASQADAKYATRIVRSILTEILPYLNIYMTEELSETEIAELEELENTLTSSYQQMLQGDVSGNDPSGTEGDETSGEEGSQDTGAAGEDTGEDDDSSDDATDDLWESIDTEVWKTFEKDPVTGNYIDPVTGHQIDPITGDDLTGTDTGELVSGEEEEAQ
ncbi:MAG: penicillin-binding protein 2 [Lachnospiraceae bacterium]|nr:penicillin-binding protein 2 [Lachnospiraceae bacterium]